MSWFSEDRRIVSEKNGIISAVRRLGYWEVVVDGCQQTGRAVHAMWKSALEIIKRFRGIQKTRSVLLLGLGGGGELKNFYRAFKGATLTVVEYDPAMVELAKDLKLYRPFPFPRVICDDAARTVPALPGTFDLIVVDLFKGSVPSPLSKDESFLSALEEKLADDGLMVVNVYQNKELFALLEEKFSLLKKWTFVWNNLALFQKRLVPKALENGYLPVREWPDLNSLAAIPPFFRPSRTGVENRGFYWWLWPFSFEKYHGNDEPNILPLPKEKQTPIRIIMWQRLTRGDRPAGWISFSTRPEYKIGFIPLTEDYTKTWSESARRSRRKWNDSFLNSVYRIEEITLEEFEKPYLQSTLPATLRGMMLGEAKTRMKNPKTPLRLIGVRRIADKKIVAGIAPMYSASLPISYYLSGFFLKEAEHDPVMAGLFDWWFQDSIKKGIKFIDLGNFWKEGDDNSWKGFSLFKGKFNPIYFFFPPNLYQFRFGKEK